MAVTQTAFVPFGVAVAVILLVVLGADGASGNHIVAGAARPANSNPANANNGAGGKRGGILNEVTNEDISQLDPGLAYFVLDYQFTYATQRPLYSYLPNDQTTPVPDLATGPPQITPDNKTITVHIRPGVHYSPPVDREVTSADVAYAIERGFNPHVASPYARLYYGVLVGADQANGGAIAGIKTPDASTIVFRLTRPVAAFVANAFVLPLSAPVPPEYAANFDAHAPSDYGNYAVATGPYKFQSDAGGKIIGIGYQPGRSVTLVRNPNWSAGTDFRPAYLDGVSWAIGVTPEVAGRLALTGSHITVGDTPPAAIVRTAYQRYRSQIFFSPGSGNRYVALNTAVAPFNDLNLRRAVFAALNRKRMGKVAAASRPPRQQPISLPRGPRLR
jgi:peptide/nickel transport system substrate-binding protein